MENYIALLRGINVSGQKMIKMAELKIHLEELDIKNVTTYIQSGNIVFQSDNPDEKKLAGEIGLKIKEKYGWDVPVIVISGQQMIYISQNNPFIKRPDKDLARLYVTFLAEEPIKELVEKFNATNFKPEELIIAGKVLYGFFPEGYGNTKFNNNFVESKLKTIASTRNWNTVLKLVEMADA